MRPEDLRISRLFTNPESGGLGLEWEEGRIDSHHETKSRKDQTRREG